jgi:membrane protease YdiL (CAAX protease family)
MMFLHSHLEDTDTNNQCKRDSMKETLSSTHPGTQDGGVPVPPERFSPLVQTVAWIALLFGSALTHVIWVEGLGYKDSPTWDYVVRFIVLVALLTLSWLWPKLRPLRGFLLAILAFNVAIDVQLSLVALPQVAALPPVLFALTTALLSVILAVVLMALTLIRSGLSRRDLFLSRGNMRARSHLPLPFVSSWRWTLVGPLAFVVLAIPLIVELVLEIHPNIALAHNMLSLLPLIIVFGIINAAQEEFTYRAVYLARLAPVVGTGQALLITSVNFGINHWVGGHPDGLVGAVTVALAGYILGRSMLDTHGIAWAWIIHTAADIIVSLLLAMMVVPH